MMDPARPGSSGPFDPKGAQGASGGSGSARSGSGGSGHTVPSGSRPQDGASAPRGAAGSRLPDAGEQIGSYLLEEHIGAGGMGTVYRARDLCLERSVALKLLPVEVANDPDGVPRFYQEARAAAQLDHENIARVFSIGHDQGYHYIAFEYIEGSTVRQLVHNNGPLPVAETVNYALQVANALVHASDRGVVHRDIKPSNIIVTPQGRAKLVDMGLARRIEREGTPPNADPLTQSGTTLGTFDYISPEQATDPRNVDTRSDLYSLGCTMFHMLTSRPPFPDGTVLQKLLQHKEDPAPDVRSAAPEVPGDLAAIVLKLMAKDPDRRYQTAEQLERDLIMVAGAHGFPAFGPAHLSWPLPQAHDHARSWERHLVWALPAVGLMALVAILVWLGQAFDPSPTTGPPSVASTSTRDAQETDRPITDRPTRSSGKAEATAPSPVPPVAAALSKSWLVRTDAQLEEALRLAPSGSEIVLQEAGPYILRAQAAPSASGTASARRNLSIRAEPGVRPVIQNAPVPAGDSGGFTLLAFGPGRVELSDLTLALDATGVEGSLAAVSLQGAEALIRGCAFRRRGSANPGGQLIAVRTQQEPAKGPLPEPLLIEQAHVDPQIQAISARGPFDGWLRDCTIAPSSLTFAFENPTASVPVPVRFGLAQCSLMPGDGTVFQFNGSRASIRVDNSVIAPAVANETTLVAIDNPANLTWIGRDNRYSRIRAFLQPSESGGNDSAVRRFDIWSADGAVSRELDSQYGGAIWEESAPVVAMSADPNAAFRLTEAGGSPWGLGAQRGAFGPINGLSVATNTTPAASGEPSPPSANAPGAGEPSAKPAVSGAQAKPEPDPVPGPMVVARPTPEGSAMAGNQNPAATPSIPAQPFDLGAEPFATTTAPGPGSEPPKTAPPATPNVDATPAAVTGVGALSNSNDLRVALSENITTDRQIHLASGVEFSLTAIRLAGTGRRVIQGVVEPGGKRPLLRFTPGDGMSPDDPLAYRNWWTIEGGTLELRHLDLVMAAGDSIASLFVMQGGARLRLVDCSVTLEGPGVAGSALFRSQPTTLAAGNGAEARPLAPVVVEVQDSLLRAGADLFLGPNDGNWRITMSETVAAGTGAFFQVAPNLGTGAGTTPPELTIDLERSAIRCQGGLLLVRSATAASAMPHVAITVHHSILSAPGNGGEPLVRVEGQNRFDEAGHWLDWRGDGVVYDGYAEYRRDTSTTPGSVPRVFNRADWELAVAGHDRSAYHGRLSYTGNGGNPPAPPWRLRPEQFQLAPDSPVLDAGPDLRRIPAPPG